MAALRSELRQQGDPHCAETMRVRLAGLPAGARLSDGVRSFVATETQSVADISGWTLSRLTLTPPQDYSGTLALQVQVTATERANGASATTVAALTVKVLPVNDAPKASALSVQLARNGSAVIDFATLVSDADGDTLTLTMEQPRYGSLARNADGSYTYTPRAGFYGCDSFAYSVNDGQQTVSATVSLWVSWSDRASTVVTASSPQTLTSTLRTQEGSNWVVINQGKPRVVAPPVTIDWAQPAPALSTPVPNGWLTQHSLDAGHSEESLAEITGLVFKRPV